MTAKLEFDEHEVPVLMELCRTLDRIDQLEEQIAADGVMSIGSQGQAVLHPAVAEQRQQQASAARLVAALQIPDEATDVQVSRAISSQAQAAANSRWNASKRARGA